MICGGTFTKMLSQWWFLLRGLFLHLFQGQFSHIGASFHYRTPFSFRVPQHSHSRFLFWLVNGSLFIVPQILAYRCLSYPSFFVTPAASSPSNAERNMTQGNRLKKTTWWDCDQVGCWWVFTRWSSPPKISWQKKKQSSLQGIVHGCKQKRKLCKTEAHSACSCG